MWSNIEIAERYAREQHREQIAIAEHSRIVAACGQPLAIMRRAARPLGHALFQLGAWLLRYGKAESPVTMRVYRPSERSIKLN